MAKATRTKMKATKAKQAMATLDARRKPANLLSSLFSSEFLGALQERELLHSECV